MEDTLGVNKKTEEHSFIEVLILVLMEDTLGVQKPNKVENQDGLNPCSNGRYSRRVRGVKALFQVGGE